MAISHGRASRRLQCALEHPLRRGLPLVSQFFWQSSRPYADTDQRTLMKPTMAFFGSSLVSSYWNGAAAYCRGLIRAIAERGYAVTFFEPAACDRQSHRDIDDPGWARVVVYAAGPRAGEAGVRAALWQARHADVIVKMSGVGVFDGLIERAVVEQKRPDARAIFWDVDAATTLDRLNRNPADPLRALLPRYDMVLTHGGGTPVVRAYDALGARRCIPIHNTLDPNRHFPVPRDPRFDAELGFLGNRCPGRDASVERFFFSVARAATIGAAARRRMCAEHTYAHRAAELDDILDERAAA